MIEHPEITDDDLKTVREWPHGGDYLALFAFIKSKWWAPDWGWHECDGKDSWHPERRTRVFIISTGGMSSNEDLMGALAENWMVHVAVFDTYRHGGHYSFVVTIQ